MSAAFSPAFLDGDPRAEAFVPRSFRQAGARAGAVRRAGERRASTQTVAALRAQAARAGTSAARSASLDALAQPGTVAVVTGQQVGLFLGPLYAVYKAASAIAVARALEAETGRRCVPVFWLQTEDHDFDEVNHCHVLGDDTLVHRLEVAGPPGRQSLSERRLGEGVLPQLDALQDLLPAAGHLGELMALLRRHYRPDARWSDAFAGVCSALFDAEGLVLLDPRDPALASQLRPVHERALRESEGLARALLERCTALQAAGFAVQVRVRADSPLSFFHPEGPQGPRMRLEPGAVPMARLLEVLQREPLCFSTSALLRPIAQDTLLPTAAIVGGPGELNYFAQLSPLYEAFGLPMPMLVPRARFRVLEPRVRATLGRLGLTADQVEAPADVVLGRLRPASAGVATQALQQQLAAAVGPVLDAVPVDDLDVADAVARTRATFERAGARLAGRYARSLQRADATVTQRLERVQRALFPHGEPQERVLALPTFAARLGLGGFTQLVFSKLSPFDPRVVELWP